MSDRYAITLKSMRHDDQYSAWRVTFSIKADFIGNHAFEVKVDDSDPAPYGDKIMRKPGDIAARAERQIAVDFCSLANIAMLSVDEKFREAIISQALPSSDDRAAARIQTGPDDDA